MNAGLVYGTRLLITALGWRGAYLALGLLTWGLLLPLTALIRRPPTAGTRAADHPLQAPPSAEPHISPSLAVAWIGVAVIFC